MAKISIIMICTRNEQYEEAKKWIEKQTVASDVEIIALDNEGNKNYSSATEALNDGARKSTGEYLIFMHQDVYLYDQNFLENCVEFLKNNKDAILGVAGTRKSDGKLCFDIFMGEGDKKFAFGTEGVPVLAITLDECLLAMKKELWQKQPFDERTCDNWHFYGADVCLANELSGGKNYIFPANLRHASFGVPSGRGFKRGAIKIAKKYKGKIPLLATTCVYAKCTPFGVRTFFIKRGIKNANEKIFGFFGLKKVLLKHRKNKAKRNGFFVEEDE